MWLKQESHSTPKNSLSTKPAVQPVVLTQPHVIKSLAKLVAIATVLILLFLPLGGCTINLNIPADTYISPLIQ